MSSNSRTPTPYEPETHLSDPDAHDAKTPPSDALSIAELITDSIPRFDHQTLVVQPYEEEVQREQEFQRKLMEMSVDLLFTFYAWAARPAHENAVEASAFESRINNVMQAEKNQEMIRGNFAQFVQQINAAVQLLINANA
ncbi:hypothetical protein BDV98DRAFT_559804 [Pterulicium gracile]|uniref:Uncharacterized protein n=1 Tax=Pterulicium gracile TaxID=1884261 RepID=A0A5C3R654_9AGAR|nr:hypothetical protein BDV98DRAFT_559804 [Pterula gracilis]